MGSPIPSVVAEIYVQHFENQIFRHWLEMGKITYYIM